MKLQIGPMLARSIPSRRRRAIARELATHLEEVQIELEAAGWDPASASQESVRRLGDQRAIAGAFAEVYRPTRHRRLGLAFGLAGAIFAGAYGAGSTLASPTAQHHVRSTTHQARSSAQHVCKHRLTVR